MTVTGTTQFHVVCRNCEFEKVVGTGGDAEALAEEHVTDRGHETTFRRIS